MAKNKKAEAKAESKAEVKAEKPTKKAKALGPEITATSKFNPCRTYAAGRSGGTRPSERFFLADEMLTAKATPLADISVKAATRWANACIKAGDKRDKDTLVTLYRKQIPVNASTITYMTEKVLGPQVQKKFGKKATFKYDGEKGTFTTTI